MSEQQSDALKAAFEQGALIVYPTEAVMGIGCDPDNEMAVYKLLQLKQRPVEKGMILIADTYSRLLPYVNDNAVPPHRRSDVFSSWPGHNTWLLPKSKTAPRWITGNHEKIAVRVTNHPVVKALCERLGKPLISTSANPSGASPAQNQQEARAFFADTVIYIDGETGAKTRPSTIRDCDTGKIIRD